MINKEHLQFDDLGYVILQENPNITTEFKTVERMMKKNESELSPFWKALFDKWKQQGILN